MSETTKLYFIRHGETDYNVKSIIQGQLINCPLNDNGRAQAELLADRLSSVTFDAFYCSTLRRAMETAKIVAAPHGISDFTLMAELQEMSFGRLEGQPYGGKNEVLFADLAKKWTDGVYTDRPGNGESILDVQERAVMAVEKIVRLNPGKTVAVVTHGRLLRVLLSSIVDGYSLQSMERLLHRNTAFSLLNVTGNSYHAEVLASDEHLANFVGSSES